MIVRYLSTSRSVAATSSLRQLSQQVGVVTFVLPGQRRLHMKDESAPRKRSIISALVDSGVPTTIYDAARRHPAERDGRAACLHSLVAHCASQNAASLVLEQDDTLVQFDRRLLFGFVGDLSCPDLRYEHRRAASEPLLALPDAVAWCWAKGGDWRRRVTPAVIGVVDV